MENVEIAGAGFFNFFVANRHATLFGGSDPNGIWASDGADNPFNNALRGPCGVYVHDTFNGSFNGAIIVGHFIMENMFNVAGAGSVRSYDALGSAFGLFFVDGAQFDAAGKLDGQTFPNPFAGILNFSGGASGHLGRDANGNPSQLDIVNSAGDAIVSENAYALVDLVTGAGNGGVGLRMRKMGQIGLVDAGAAYNATVTGAAGDIAVGAVPVATYAAVHAAGGLGETDGAGDSTLNRVQSI
jgi:hypothetical protein